MSTIVILRYFYFYLMVIDLPMHIICICMRYAAVVIALLGITCIQGDGVERQREFEARLQPVNFG